MKKILLVEDESAIADALTYAFKTEGFEILWCSKVAEARAEIKKQSFDLLILDVGLPDESGFDFCRELRQFSQVPVLFLTARSSEIDRIVGLEIGADDYVVKPFSPRELTARAKAILRRSTANSANAFIANKNAEASPSAGFEVQDEQKKISFQGKPLNLSRYEYLLLKFLIERPGRVFSRDQLMELVWGNALTSMDRTVDAHIKTLRSKLKEIAPDSDPIETHRGMGYSFRES